MPLKWLVVSWVIWASAPVLEVLAAEAWPSTCADVCKSELLLAVLRKWTRVDGSGGVHRLRDPPLGLQLCRRGDRSPQVEFMARGANAAVRACAICDCPPRANSRDDGDDDDDGGCCGHGKDATNRRTTTINDAI